MSELPNLETALSGDEMARREGQARHMCETWLQAYLSYPTHNNMQGLQSRLNEYQSTWMNGRVRRSA